MQNTNTNIYDLIIIGAGPAGLTASIYASCYHLKNLIIGAQIGGQLQYAPDILNYPGFEDISGKELTERMVGQVKKRGGEIIQNSVVEITQFSRIKNQELRIKEKVENTNNSMIHDSNPMIQSAENSTIFGIRTQNGKYYETRCVILATGMERRKLNVSGENEYTGKGVHYCATCEKQDYEGKTCAVVGGGNAAVQATVELATAAKKVYLIYRGTELRGDAVWLEKIRQSENIEVLYNTIVKEIKGNEKRLTKIKLEFTGPAAQVSQTPLQFARDKSSVSTIKSSSLAQSEASFGKPSFASPVSKIKENITIDKIFIEIGGVPGTALVIPIGVEVDSGGYIRVNPKLETNIPGIFAAGDMIRYGFSIEQISSAVGLGARAASSAFAYLTGGKTPSVWGKAQINR